MQGEGVRRHVASAQGPSIGSCRQFCAPFLRHWAGISGDIHNARKAIAMRLLSKKDVDCSARSTGVLCRAACEHLIQWRLRAGSIGVAEALSLGPLCVDLGSALSALGLTAWLVHFLHLLL